MLEVRGLEASYGASQILFGVDLDIAAGEVVTLLGRNGMGKTTTVRTIMGLMRPKSGSVAFAGRALAGLPAYRIAQAGLGLVPEGRQIFPNLSVRENLVATARAPASGDEPWTLERIFALFPRLAERQANMGNQLSGGEQQMLAVGRALMTNPRLLILDEATEGLAPIIRAEIWRCLAGSEGAAPGDPRHRQESRGADAPGRPALCSGKRPHRLARHVGGVARGCNDPPALSGRLAPAAGHVGVDQQPAQGEHDHQHLARIEQRPAGQEGPDPFLEIHCGLPAPEQCSRVTSG